MSVASKNPLDQLCKRIDDCAKLDTARCVDMRTNERQHQLEIQQWAKNNDGLIDMLTEAQAICKLHGRRKDADRLRELRFRLSDYMVGVLTSSPTIGDLRGLCWAVNDLRELAQVLPETLFTYTTSEWCEELLITNP